MTPALPIEVYLICFAAASVIHGAQVVLAAKMIGQPGGCSPAEARDGILIAAACFLWQFGNFFTMLIAALAFPESSALFGLANFIRNGALVGFPLIFSYGVLLPPGRSRLLRLASYLRYPLWPWTVFALMVTAAASAGIRMMDSWADRVGFTTLHIMLVYFVIYTLTLSERDPDGHIEKVPSLMHARKAAMIAVALAIGTFVLMLGGYWRMRVPFLAYIELAAMLTSVPFAIAAAYRLYQFPFMDSFIREVVSGLILLIGFIAGMSVSKFPVWIVACALVLAYSKAPLTRWVERTFIGYEESVEEQEERIGAAIRALTRLDEFPTRVSEILREQLSADWVEIDAAARAGAAHVFDIPGSGLCLAIGARAGGRKYMSRQLRISRTAALQLAAHHHQLSQHALRDATARAQMRALQAQINPHFLFNTLNVLANLIHTNPTKAERVTEELADIFRYALESTRVEWVKLDDELLFMRSCLEIEKARFEDRLAYFIEVDAATCSLRIPPMILQPLVENAIKHGVGPKLEGGTVRISAKLVSDRLEIVVEDTGVGRVSPSRRGAGIGLNNIRERLQHQFGNDATLRLEDLQPTGTRAVLVMPVMAGVAS